MKRGFIYIVWGRWNQKELDRSIASVEALGYPHHVYEVDPDTEVTGKCHMLNKALYMREAIYQSGFEVSCILDTDTIVLRDPAFGFARAEKHGLAAVLAPFCWAHRWDKSLHPDEPEWNTGVIFINEDCQDFLHEWESLAEDHLLKQIPCEQVSFGIAAHHANTPIYALPQNYNFRACVLEKAKVCGPITIWHSRERKPPEDAATKPLKLWNYA